jgi:hypothetical protein
VVELLKQSKRNEKEMASVQQELVLKFDACEAKRRKLASKNYNLNKEKHELSREIKQVKTKLAEANAELALYAKSDVAPNRGEKRNDTMDKENTILHRPPKQASNVTSIVTATTKEKPMKAQHQRRATLKPKTQHRMGLMKLSSYPPPSLKDKNGSGRMSMMR